MRDIREDLRHRLQAIAAQRGMLQMQMSALGQAEANIKGLLEYEKMRVQMEEAENQRQLFPEEDMPTVERSAVALFLRDVLADGRPRSLEDLKKDAAIRGLDFDGKNPGRVLHFALVGMARSEIVHMVESGVWQLTTEQSTKPNGSAAKFTEKRGGTA